MQSLRTIELDVLKGVEDVESSNPRSDRRREQNKHPPRIAPRSRDREISSHWRNRQTNAEHQVTQSSKSFCVAVDKYPCQSKWRQQQTQSVELPRSYDEHDARNGYRERRCCNSE